MNGFRARISELNAMGLNIKHREVKFKNRFGNSGMYRERYLTKTDKSRAVKMYNNLNK
jgi:hypothetical protein